MQISPEFCKIYVQSFPIKKFTRHRADLYQNDVQITKRCKGFCLYLLILNCIVRNEIFYIIKWLLPKVSKEVTPRVTLAGMASGLIQNEIQDMTTMRADGM